MSFSFSTRSLSKLSGVDPRLVTVAREAIKTTSVDFGVTCGLRTASEQRDLVARGASKTLKSKHIDGLAIDVVAYIGTRVSWELNLYDNIADAMRQAAVDKGVSVRWGAAWHINDIREWRGTMEEAMMAYVDLRRSQGRRPFIDGPHFEITD